MPDWNHLLTQNPEPTILDAIEFAEANDNAKPAPKRRVRIVQDSHPSDPRDDDNVCHIEGDFSWRTRSRAEYIAGLIRDTDGWRVVEQLLAAADPDWNDGDGPDIEGDESVRNQWLEKLKDCLIVREFSTEPRNGYDYVAYTTPEMCAKLGVEWANAERALDGEVETFQQWAEGDVYGFVVEEWEPSCDCADCDAGDWVAIDSCWGFYGSDPFENGMSDHVDEELHEQLRAAEVEYWAWQ